MSEVDAALRTRFMSEEMPYLSYVVGEKRRGIFRIGKWHDSWTEYDGKGNHVSKKKTFNVTPKKAYKILYTLRKEWWMADVHLWIEPLPKEEQEEWKRQFSDMDVVYDKVVAVP